MSRLILSKYIIFIFLIVYPLNVLGQRIYYVGIPSSKLNYISSAQKKPHWCWAASIQMVFNYYQIAITQEQIVDRTYGRSMNGELPNWSAGIETIHMNLNNWSVDNKGKKYIVNAQFGIKAPEPIFLIEELSKNRPVIIGYKSNFGGHVVVITALSYIETDYGPVIRSIVVKDPLPEQINTTNYGRIEYNASTLANRIQAHWFIRVLFYE